MNVFFTGLFTLFSAFNVAQSLVCMTCFNAASYAECDRRGHLQRCDVNENSCQTEVRFHEGFGTMRKLIRKQCKSSIACDDNRIQNPNPAWYPVQCNPHDVNSVCRCCCTSDRCNVGVATCFGGCPSLVPLLHGSRTCTRGSLVASVCTHSCDTGFRMNGAATSRCVESNGVKRWTEQVPSCRAISCHPPVTQLNMGNFTCTRGNDVGSVCRFRCRSDHRLAGSPMIFCRRIPGTNRRGVSEVAWSGVQPVCSLDGIRDLAFDFCTEKPPVPPFGVYTCNRRRHSEATVCSFKCRDSHIAVGEMLTTCVRGIDGKLSWSNAADYYCKARCLPTRPTIENGMVNCTGDSSVGDRCQFSCDEHYVLRGATRLTCVRDGVGGAMWDNDNPFCKLQPVCGCAVPRPQNGTTTCPDGSHTEGIVCNFTCNLNFKMVGNEQVTCVRQVVDDEDSLNWSNSAPLCKPKRCPTQSMPHGEIYCSNETFVHSVCSFQCEENHYLLPRSFESNRCLPTEQYDMFPYCCEPTCPPIVPGNMLILLDAWSGISPEDWFGFLNITESLINTLTLNNESLHIGILPYSDEPKDHYFTEFIANKEILRRSLNELPFNLISGETATHVTLDTILTRFNSIPPRDGASQNQPSSVLVLTMGESLHSLFPDDRVQSSAHQISAANIEILAAGFGEPGEEIETKLNHIAGEGSYVVLERGLNVESWKEQVLAIIGNRLCRKRNCLHNNHSHGFAGVTLTHDTDGHHEL